MGAIRRVNGVAILDWETGPGIPPLAHSIKSLLEGGDVQHVLVNMGACNRLQADSFETLTEILTVCRDRSCNIGMFAVQDRLERLMSVTGLTPELPPVLGQDENTAVTSIKNGGANAASAPMSGEPQLEFEIELDAAATAPTARFDPMSVTPTASGAHSVSQSPADQADKDLLAVFWADLASQGYAIGGADAQKIMDAVARDPSTPTTAGGGSSSDEVVIDLDDGPPPVDVRGQPTEKLSVFNPDAHAAPAAAGWSANPAHVQADFSQQSAGITAQPAGVFGGQETAEYSAVDTARGPQAPPAAVEQAIDDADETVMIQPGALEAALLQAGLGAGAPAPTPAPAVAAAAPAAAPQAEEDQSETVMFQPGALDAALLAEVAKAAGAPSPASPPPVEAPPPEAQPFANLPEEEQEVRQFLSDYAINSNLHVQLLERFYKSKDDVLGRSDLQLATGGNTGQVIEIVDQFVQSRLVRRARSMRVRGGTGFTFSTSPANANRVVRLLRMWQSPGGRAKVTTWLQG